VNYKKIAAVVGAVMLAVGCTSKVDGQAVSALAATSKVPAPTSSASAAPSSSASAAPAGGDAGITPTGTTLTVGQPATVLYNTEDLGKDTTKLTVTAVSVKKGAITDLKNFDLDAQTKASEPYYITMSFKNAGPAAMKPGGIFGLINVNNTAGDELGRLSLIGDFKPCHGLPPDSLAVGASYTDCEVYVAPPGQNVADVVFAFYIESTRTEITWKAS
jgi:hypothetical protein